MISRAILLLIGEVSFDYICTDSATYLLSILSLRFPHPATLYGLLEMGSMYLPINDSWLKFQERADRTFSDNERRQRELLVQLANQALDRYQQPGSE